MSVTLAERLTMQNSEIHSELDKVRKKLPRLHVADIVDAVKRGDKYNHPEDIGTSTKRAVKKLKHLVKQKKRMDF